MYGFVLRECFDDCIVKGSFHIHSQMLSGNERACITNCTGKLLKLTNRMGELLAEKQQQQMTPAQQQGTTQ